MYHKLHPIFKETASGSRGSWMSSAEFYSEFSTWQKDQLNYLWSQCHHVPCLGYHQRLYTTMGCINFLGSLDVIIGLTGLVIQVIDAFQCNWIYHQVHFFKKQIITIADPNGEVLPNKSFPSDFNEHYGVGIWSGILFILAGIASFRFSTLLKYDM